MLKFLFKRYIAHIYYSIKNFLKINSLPENKALKNIHLNEEVYILGSGSSINETDLKKLSGKIVMTQNNFHIHEDIGVICPKFHCVVPMYQPKEFDEDWLLWINSMKSKLPTDTKYFWGLNTKHIINKVPGIKNNSYYIMAGLKPLFMNSARINICNYIMNIPTALTLCLTTALYMGFSKIYLVGFDMDQICKQKEKDVGRFYGESIITKNTAEKEIHQQLIDDGKLYFSRWVTLIQLKLLRKMAEKEGREIINLTKGGMLFTFKRENYDDVVK